MDAADSKLVRTHNLKATAEESNVSELRTAVPTSGLKVALSCERA